MSPAEWAYLAFHAAAFIVGAVMVMLFRLVMKRRTELVKHYNESFRAECSERMERTRSWGTAFAAKKNGKQAPTPDPIRHA